MAILIKTLDTAKTYILLGSGYGMFQSEKPYWSSKSGRAKAICACDQHGNITWLRSDSVQVISIDGKAPQEYYKHSNQ